MTAPSPICEGCYFHDDKEGCTDGREQFDGCYVDEIKRAIEQSREAEVIAFDQFAADPACHRVTVGGIQFTRRF